MATLGELNIQIAANVAQLSQDVTKVEREMRKMRNAGVKASKQMDTAAKAITGFKSLAKSVGGVLIALKGLQVGLRVASRVWTETITEADKIAKTADKVGVTTNALQELSFAAEQTGVKQETLNMALQRFSRRIGEAVQGKGELLGIIKQYGVAITDSEGKTRDNVAIFNDFANVIAKTEDKQEKLRIAFKLFDSEGAALVNLMNKGAEGVDEFKKQAESMGLVLNEDVVRKAAEAKDEIALLTTQIKVGLMGTLLKFADPAAAFARDMQKMIIKVKDFFAEIRKADEQFRESDVFGFASEEDTDDPGAKQREEANKTRARRAKQEAEDIARISANAKKAIRAQSQAEELQAQIAHNGEMIEEAQSQWERELRMEQNLDQLKESMHQRQLERDKKEKESNISKIQTASRVARGILGSISQIATASSAGQKTRLKIAKAQGTVDSISAALTAFGTAPYPYNYVAAGLALAAGLSKVSQMGSGSATAMGRAPEPPQADIDSLLADQQKQAQLNTTQTTIVFQGGTFVGGDRESLARDLTPAIETALSDGVR